MRNPIVPTLARWPFLLGDVLLLCLAYFIFSQSRPPMQLWEASACILCVLAGATFSILPFVLEYRAATKIAEANALSTVVARIQQVEQLAAQISSATARWQDVQESADKTGRIAKEIAERMAGEIKAFNEFLQRAHEGEKSALRLEVEKLRRAEGEWLQVLVRMLDQVYALHQAGLRSQQPALIDQLGQFQNACRDAARRIGLTPFVATQAESFDEKRHQLADSDAKPSVDARVSETLATGYTYQGRLLRPALVRVAGEAAPNLPDAAGESLLASKQSQLPLESAEAPSP